MRMANRNRERVRLVWRQSVFQGQDRSNHMLDLLFVCTAPTDDRLFHLPCRILEQLGIAAKRATNRCGASVPELQGAVRISVDKNLFNRHVAGTVLVNQFTDTSVYTLKPCVEGLFCNSDTPATDVTGDRTITFNDAVSGHPRPRIYAQNPDDISHDGIRMSAGHSVR
jgi:hypothetical protein